MIAPGVVRDLCRVLAAIELDDDRRFQTDEVTDVEADLMLAAEFDVGDLTTPQASPKQALGRSGIVSELTDVTAYRQTVVASARHNVANTTCTSNRLTPPPLRGTSP